MKRDDDLLERATRALREEPGPSEKELADARAVLVWAQRGARKKQRSRTLRWVLPLAAVLTAGSALAATSGQVERAIAAVAAWIAPDRPERRAERREERAPAPVAPPSAPASRDATDVPTPDPVTAAEPTSKATDGRSAPAPVSRVSPARRSRSPAPRPAALAPPAPLPPPVAEPGPEPMRDPDLAAYREAHELHFRARDFRAALAAWDGYLAQHPRGTFALEALYNRAICLLRLGRKEEARAALAPFARGAMQGGYRQAEATELLEALE